MKLIDDIGRKVNIPKSSQRIVSLCPSITETVCGLGACSRLIGITDYCIHPMRDICKKNRIGGPKTLDIEKIQRLKPGIILSSKEENEKSQIETLAKYHEVYVFDINTFDDALRFVQVVGKILDEPSKADRILVQIEQAFSNPLITQDTGKTCLYLVWKKPWMAAGKNTFIDSMLCKTGFKNIMSKPTDQRYFIIDNLKVYEPGIVFLPSEPYHFKEVDKKEIQAIFPKSIVVLVDGEMFCWYGIRMLKSAGYFVELKGKIKGS